MEEIDIYRTANLLIRQHGEGALAQAETRMQRYAAFKDEEATAVWKKVVEAIQWMQMPGNLAQGSTH